jgi:hypothetical protein
MKGIVSILLGVIFLTSGCLNAQEQNRRQDQQSKKERMNEMNNQAKEDLGLSDEQSKEWNNIQKDFMQEKDAIRNDEGLTQDQRREKQQELVKNKDEAIKTILTKEQYLSYQEIIKERRNQFGDGQGKGKNGPMGHNDKGRRMLDKAKVDLDLTKEQSEQWDAIAKSYGDKMRAIKNDDSLDDTQRRAEVKSNKVALEKELMAILDSEQQDTFQEFIKENKEKRNQQRSGSGNRG